MSSTDFLQKLFGLNDLTAVVIGGTGVLGGAFSQALAGAGAHVVVTGRNEANGMECVKTIEESGGTAEFFAADSTRKEDLENLVQHLMDNDRRCDILVNGAGVNSATPFLEIEDDEWEKILNVNLNSVRLGCQVFGKMMLEDSKGGSIINIASLSGITALSRVFTYAATKAAVINLTQNLAREWGTSNIRVNAISPGFFPAEQNRKVLTPDRIESIMGHTPMDRFGEPDELAGITLLLASPVAGSFITGGNFIVDGGFSAMTI